MSTPGKPTAEGNRLDEDTRREKNWKRWGPYLSERQWGTVREDYSRDGTCWDYFPHDHARSRVYRWGEDGIMGITDRECRLCFSLSFWNGHDPILKERMFGLTGPEGNHGEDVKEFYFYVDSTPTHSYMKSVYKYPQAEYPYQWLVEENRRRGREDPEFNIEDSGVFENSKYWDVTAEYAKGSPDDNLIKITLANRGDEKATLHFLPTLWFRNTWSWGREGEGYWKRPKISRAGPTTLLAEHESLGKYRLNVGPGQGGAAPSFLFTENETNAQRLFGAKNAFPNVKDGFHEYVVNGKKGAASAEGPGTKAAAWYRIEVPARSQAVVHLRLSAEAEAPKTPFGEEFNKLFDLRLQEANEYYDNRLHPGMTPAEKQVARQALASLLNSKQFYHYIVAHWMEGDPSQPPPPEDRLTGRNMIWKHLYNRDIISMPDKWEYPWYAAWDLSFHMIPLAKVDPHFAKEQLLLFLREWYMHPNGQIPAYEFAFGDVNPPVHAWSCWRVYKMSGPRGKRDRSFLARAFQKLLINFTWWVNRTDDQGNNLFTGGFLGLDNIGVFDRSRPLPTGGYIEQADATAWMAFYCATLFSIAVELAKDDPSYEDVASKFFEHFVAISDAINTLGGTGLFDEEDGFYYDLLMLHGRRIPMRIRSMVGIIPLLSAQVMEQTELDHMPGFKRRMKWFLENRKDLAAHISFMQKSTGTTSDTHRLLAIPSRDRLVRVLKYVLDENEFLSPYGIRSVSRVHKDKPYVLRCGEEEYRIDYTPGESTSGMFGGNSNWRGPIWMPINYLLVESLDRYFFFYGDTLKVECPTGSGKMMNLREVAFELAKRISNLFLPGKEGRRPCYGDDERWATDPHCKDLVTFHEYFHGDSGKGLGASHQGWTYLVADLLEDVAQKRTAAAKAPAPAAPAPAPVAPAVRR
ncbi:MAG: glucosidase [Planctomycetes bacterium]|nr:glucosidase [Planctomycetota bacterium]